MTDDLDASKVKWLTYLVYFLLAILTIMGAWNTVRINDVRDNMPKEYVRLERYLCDNGKIETTLQVMNSKLDRLVERGLDDGKKNRNP